MKKTLLTILCTVLVCSCVMGATLALLTAKTDTVTNTFTIGNVNIALTETKELDENGLRTFKMVPGSRIDKDPMVTVVGGSEACWLFVKIDKANNFDTYMTFATATGWTELTTGSGIYYREVASNAADQTFYVLSGGTGDKGSVLVNDDITKAQADALTTSKAYPTLSFTAYAVQKDNVADAAAAWAAINP